MVEIKKTYEIVEFYNKAYYISKNMDLLDKCYSDDARASLIKELKSLASNKQWVSKESIIKLYLDVFSGFNIKNIFEERFSFLFTKLLFIQLGIDAFPKNSDGSICLDTLYDPMRSDSKGERESARNLAKSFSSSLESDFLAKECSKLKGDK